MASQAAAVRLPSYPGIEIRGQRDPDASTGSTASTASTASTSSASRGRSMHATRAFGPGERIGLFASPLFALPSGPAVRSVCNQCLSSGGPVKVCTGCRAVAYCGAACQKAHWALVHRRECAALQRVAVGRAGHVWLPLPVRAVVQILLRWASEPAVRDAVAGLDGHVERFRASAEGRRDVELQAMAACTYAGWDTTEQNLKLATEILCKVSETQ